MMNLMLYTGKSSERASVVKKLPEVCISGWNSTFQPYIVSATAFYDMYISQITIEHYL